MALDVKKILDDINPSEKVMKWLIVALVASVTVIFGWGIKRGKSINELESLQKDVTEIMIKVESLEKNTPITVESEVTDGMNSLKLIVFKEINDLENEMTDKITLVVESQGEVTKEWLLKAIDIRERSNRTLNLRNSNDNVKKITFSTHTIEPIMSQAPSNTEVIDEDSFIIKEDDLVIEDLEPTIIDSVYTIDENVINTDSINNTDSTKKKTFFLLKIFKK